MPNHLKFADGSRDIVEGLGAPFGGPFNGADLAGERFTERTDFALDWYPERPLIYHHGLSEPGIAVVGRVKAWEVRPGEGLWVQAQLDAHNEYFGAISQLIDKGSLGLSSGAMSHLVEVDKKSGEIKCWPWVEMSLTPTPCNPLAQVDFATAKAHFKAIGVELVEEHAGLKAAPQVGSDPLPAEDRERSYEDLLDELRTLLNPVSPYATGAYTSILATYPDHVLVCRYGDYDGDYEPPTYYDIPYATAEDGTLQLGLPVEVERVFVPVKAAVGVVPLTTDAGAFIRHAGALSARTKDLRERRVKEGRAISGANRTLIADAATASEQAATALRELLDATDTPTAKAVTVSDVQRMQLDQLALWSATI